MKISHIFFDLGKVLVDFDFSIAAGKIMQQSPLSPDEVTQEFYRLNGLIDEYETGSIDSETFFTRMKAEYRFTGNTTELREIWCSVFSPLDEHIQMAKCLAQFYPLALISNTSEAHITYLESQYDFFPIFRKKFYSHEVRCMKPNPEIYDHALKEMGADKFESLFIDDREENVEAVAKRGWQTIHLRPDVNLRLALQSYDLRGV